MGDEQQSIVICEGDTAEGLAEEFCKSHGLDLETKEQLTMLLQNQLDQWRESQKPKVNNQQKCSETKSNAKQSQ